MLLYFTCENKISLRKRRCVILSPLYGAWRTNSHAFQLIHVASRGDKILFVLLVILFYLKGSPKEHGKRAGKLWKICRGKESFAASESATSTMTTWRNWLSLQLFPCLRYKTGSIHSIRTRKLDNCVQSTTFVISATRRLVRCNHVTYNTTLDSRLNVFSHISNLGTRRRSNFELGRSKVLHREKTFANDPNVWFLQTDIFFPGFLAVKIFANDPLGNCPVYFQVYWLKIPWKKQPWSIKNLINFFPGFLVGKLIKMFVNDPLVRLWNS